MTYEIDFEKQIVCQKPTEQQKAVREKSNNIGIAASQLARASLCLSEAAGWRMATLLVEDEYLSGWIEKTRQNAIQELLDCIELLGGEK